MRKLRSRAMPARKASAKTAGKEPPVALGEKLISKLTARDPDDDGLGFEEITEEEKGILNRLVLDVVRCAQVTRRRHSRIETLLDVRLRREDQTFKAETKDLSLGGMFLVSDLPVAVGDVFDFVLTLPEGLPPVGGRGKVVYLKPPVNGHLLPGFGLQFLEVDVQALRQYLIMLVSGEVRPGGVERRRHGRIKRLLLSRVATPDGQGEAQVIDISLGGAFLQADLPAVIGAKVQMTIVSPLTLQKLRVAGKIVRVVDSSPSGPNRVRGTGVVFEKMAKAKMGKLLSFLIDIITIEAAGGDFFCPPGRAIPIV